MKLVWSGFGFVLPVLGGIAFIGLMVALDAHQKDDFWVWGALALGLALVALPLGLVVNSRARNEERGGRQHHFMYIPLQWWGGLLLVAGIGLFVAEAVTGEAFASTEPDGPSPCVTLGEVMSSCTTLGPAAGMFVSACEASDPSVQRACLACVQAASDRCNPSACSSACRFGPP